MTNPILSFLTELVVRYKAKSPTFFKIIQWVSIVVTLVTGLPEFLTWCGVQNLPDWFTLLQSKVISIASLVAVFLSGLPVDGDPNLPFTDQTKK